MIVEIHLLTQIQCPKPWPVLARFSQKRRNDQLPIVDKIYRNSLDQSHQPTRSALNRAQMPPNDPMFASCKIPESFKKSPLSGAGKYPDFQGESNSGMISHINLGERESLCTG